MNNSQGQHISALEEQTKALQARLDAVIAERDAIAAERDAAIVQRDRVRQSYERLKEHYYLLDHRLKVAKAERVDTAQLELEFADTKAQLDKLVEELSGEKPDGEPSEETLEPKKKRPSPTGRRNLGAQNHIPLERIEIDDPELEGNAERIGFEESWYLGYRRGGHVRIVVARVKYKQTDGDATTYSTADKPETLLRRALLAPSLIAHILAAKYCYGLPFHRQMQQLANEGLSLDDGTMCRYAENIGASLGPIVDACAAEAKASAFCLSTDATGIAIQPVKDNDKPRSRQACSRGHFFVVLADQDHIFFEYQRKQNSDVICDMFRGFQGYIQADAHSVYNALFRGEARSGPEEKAPVEVGCWSHCRTKFWEAATATKEPIALEALLRIRKLFELEDKWQKLPPARRLEMRRQVASKLVDAFFEWVTARFDEVKFTRGLLRTACGYAVRQKDALRRYLTDGRLKITNNHSERALRAIAVGRKAWLFCGSDDHAISAANLLSLVASCKLHRLDPEAYLAEVIRVMPYWPRERYIELAPKYWSETRARLSSTQLALEFGPLDIPSAEQAIPA